MDGGIAFCAYSKDVCPIVNCKTQQGNTRESSQERSSMYNSNQYRRKHNVGDVTDEEVLTHDLVISDYYSHDQDKMTTAQIYALKCKTFPYLGKSDVRLKMSDRVIIKRDLDLVTGLVLSETDGVKVKDFYYSCRECLSTHNNPSVQNKTFVSLRPINLKPFYIRPYLSHEKEIKYAEKEMEKYRLMGILHKGSSELLSPIMFIKKSHDGTKLNKEQEYCMVVDFKHLNSHLPDIIFRG